MEKDWRPKSSDNQFEKVPANKPSAIPVKLSARMDDAPVFESNESDSGSSNGSRVKYIGLACIGLLVLALIVFLGARAMTGYAVYGAMEESGIPSTYATNMIGLQTELTNNKDQLAQTKTDLDTARAAKDAALQQTQSLASANDGLTSKLSESETLATALEQERDEARSALQESARQLCCVQRVLNPQIDSYGLEKGVIVCGESKTVSIKC